MKIVDPGHLYELQSLDDLTYTQQLRFVKREGIEYPGNVGHYPGTIIQDVLRVCIDRLKYVDNQIPHPANDIAKFLLRSAIFQLEWRAAERHGVEISITPKLINIIENLSVGENGHLIIGAGIK